MLSEISPDTVLEIAILLAILVEICLGWSWQKEARKWHKEEMAMWYLENGGNPRPEEETK